MSHFDEVKYDWQGNLIQAGQTLVVVNVRSMVTGGKIFFPLVNGEHKEIKLPDPPEYIWKPVYEVEVLEIEGKLFYQTTLGEFTVVTPLIKFMFPAQPNFQAVCIKGVSDNEELYYLNHFA